MQGALETEIQPRESKIADIRKSLPELKDFDKARVQAILERWESAQHQIDNRLVGLVQAEQKLEQFQGGLQNELDWLNRVEEKVESRVWSADTDNSERVMEELTVSWKRFGVVVKIISLPLSCSRSPVFHNDINFFFAVFKVCVKADVLFSSWLQP